MSTDQAWVQWGERDPYFAVITDPKYRSDRLTDQARAEFFETGRLHLAFVLAQCRLLAGAAFKPRRALDFGCGVGRVVVPMAEQCEQVVGVDVSPAMLDEASRNCRERGLGNVAFVVSDDELSAVQGRFDLVHSCIVFQHIDVPRGRRLFERLIALLAPGGVGAIQITYARASQGDTLGQVPFVPPAPAEPVPAKRSLFGLRPRNEPEAGAPAVDPEMQMNPYHLGELAFMLQRAGVRQFNAHYTDHGGELGVFLFFCKP